MNYENNILISICIPTYSRLHYLKEAVQSALNQNYNNIEICIAQDPAPTGIDVEINNWCEELSNKENRVKYHINEKNLGLAGNWNKLVEIAKGEFIIIIGDDDLLKENFVSSMVNLIEATYADVYFSNQEFIDADGKLLVKETKRLNNAYKRDELKNGLLEDSVQSVFNNSIPMSAALIRRLALAKYRFDEQMNTPELEVFLQLALEGKRFAYCNAQLACYRIHTGSATSVGLSIERLLDKIIDIKVPEKYQSAKENFISSKIIPAINFSLKRNNKKLASKLLRSQYYPQGKKLIRFIQFMLLYSPEVLANTFYKRIGFPLRNRSKLNPNS